MGRQSSPLLRKEEPKQRKPSTKEVPVSDLNKTKNRLSVSLLRLLLLLSSSTYQPVSFGCILLGQVRIRRWETRKRHNHLKDRTAQEGLIYGGQPASPQEEEGEEDITSYLLRDFVFHIVSLSVAAQDDLSEEATRQQQPLRKHKHYPSYGRLLQSPLLLLCCCRG